MSRKDTPDVRTSAKADTVKMPKDVADQLKIAKRFVEKYHDALRDITE